MIINLGNLSSYMYVLYVESWAISRAFKAGSKGLKKQKTKTPPWFPLIRKLGTILSPQRCRIDFDDIRGDFQTKTTTKDAIISGLLRELLNRIT